MSDIEKSGDSVTLPSIGYSLKPMFMFISCIIMNIVMFNSCLNIHTSTWIVSLTPILKCLFKYGIKIYQNIVYHLTPSPSATPLGLDLASHVFLKQLHEYRLC
jgi:hypothetical protein